MILAALTGMYRLDAIEQIRQHMLSREESLSAAESVTSGHLQAAISLADEASRFFQGGITVYNLGQKARHLSVNPIHADSCNSVSQIIADEMAMQCLKLFSSDWAIGVTGYASPVPELGVKDLFAFYAIAYRQAVVCRGRIESESNGLINVQVHYTNHILRKFQNHLSSESGTDTGDAGFLRKA